MRSPKQGPILRCCHANAVEQITLRPVRGTGPLLKEHGVWVLEHAHPAPTSFLLFVNCTEFCGVGYLAEELLNNSSEDFSMRLTSKVNVLTLALCTSVAVFGQTDRVPNGTEVTVRTNEAIDAKSPSESRIYTGVVDRDVLDNAGKVIVPRGADAELIVRDVSAQEVVLDLESVTVDGRRYVVSTTDKVVTADESGKEGVGKNKRTGKYVGGGAVIGSIIGAIAGGGKGAAIGAATGAGAGAVGQSVTRGGNVRVPSETLLTFRLDRALRVSNDDDRYTREGVRYKRLERNNRQYNNR